MAKASDVFLDGNPDAKLKEVQAWLNSKGVRDFEAVSLFCDQLDKVLAYSTHAPKVLIVMRCRYRER